MSESDICPIGNTTDLFNRKWIFCIMAELFKGKNHFNEFKEKNPALSNHVLAQTLKYMEQENLITKISSERSTEYHLTEKGRKANKILYEMTLYSLNELECSKLDEKTKKEILDEYKLALNID